MATTSQESKCNRSGGGAGLRHRFARLAAASGLFVLVGTLGVITPTAAQAATGVLGVSVTSDGSGYAAVSSTGEVHAFGSVVQRGNPSGFTGTIAGISVTADGQGYAPSPAPARYTPTAPSNTTATRTTSSDPLGASR